MAFKPEISGGTSYEPLPEGEYKFIVTPPKDGKWLVEKPEWKLEYDLAAWNERQKEKDNPRILDSIDDLPADKKIQIQVSLKVREGEYEGRYLPTVYLNARFNTDPKFLDRSNWFKLCKVIVPDLKKRAAAGDLPDFDEELVGFGAIADVEVTEKGRNKIVAFRKDDTFGKRIKTPAEFAVDILEAEDIPW